MKPVRAASLLAETTHGVLLECGGGLTCRISLLAERLARVIFLHDGVPRLDRTWAVPALGTEDVPWEGRDRLDEAGWVPPPFRLEQTDAHLRLIGPAMTVEIRLRPFALRWLLPDGQVFAADRPDHAYLFAGAGAGTALRHHLARDTRDRYFGLGDKTGRLDLHGRRLRIAMLDSLGFDPQCGDPLYKHWPFLITQDGATGTAYGMFYDSGAEGVFDLGAEHDNYYGLYRSYGAEDGDLDYYMALGPALRDVTPAFLALTGRTALPPRWTLGFAQTAMAIADVPDAQAQMEAFLDSCAAHRVPVSAFHFGSGYTSIGPRRYVFNWNRSKFPDPDGLMRRFHAAGMQVVANLKPCLLDDHPAYAQALADGAFVRDAQTGAPVITQFWDGEGAHVDFTNPAGIAWWQAGLAAQVLAPGMDVAWNDNNEYGLWDDASTCDGFGRPVRLALVRAVQAQLMTRASVEQQRRSHPDRRPFSVTRAGGPGIQRYAQTWSGDNSTSWTSLRWNLRLGLAMSLSGMLNTGHDVGGFSGPVADGELLTRWTQSGLLHPRFIMNSWKPDGVYNSPWLHPAALPAIRAAIRLRYRLLPYLYSLMHAAHRDGAPVFRPTFLDHDDPACFADCDELMLGGFLLAAPVVEPGARARSLYLPRGPDCWFDFYSGEMLAAGATALLAAPLDRLPLLAPAGAILPMTAEAADFSRLHNEPSRAVRLFPGPGAGTSRFCLVEDDGASAEGASTRLDFTMEWTPVQVVLRLQVKGGFALPFDRLGVSLPLADGRALVLQAPPDGPALVAEPFRWSDGA